MSGSQTKSNLATIVGGVLFLILLVLGLLGLHRAWNHNRQVLTELDTERDQLKTLISTKPYPPTRENAKVLSEDRATLDGLYKKLDQAAAHPVPVPHLTRVEFASLLAQKLAELLKAARNAKVNTPDQFAFGFNDYILALPPANPELLTRLTKELIVIERLSRLLISDHAEQIIQITRLDTASARPGATTAEDANALYHVTPFEFQFVCSTDTLKSFLNSLSQSDWVFVVRSLTINAHRVAVASRSGGGAARRPPAGLPSGAFLMPGMLPPPVGAPGAPSTGLAQPEAASKTERDLLTVTLRIDLVELTPPPTERTRVTRHG